MNRWTLMLLLGFTTMFVMNAIYIYVAVSGADEVVPSYQTVERR